MARSIRYYYPNEQSPTAIKVFFDLSYSIRAIFFSKNRIGEAKKLEYANNYGIYFLLGQKGESALSQIYIGQTTNGVMRIQEHQREKDFWSTCILFVTNNNSFDRNAIDYMEHSFIQKSRESKAYHLVNTDMREKSPNISFENLPEYNQYIAQIEFLLKAEGIDFEKAEETCKHCYPSKSQPTNNLFVQDKCFYLEAGGIISPRTAPSKSPQSQDIQKKQRQHIQDYLAQGCLRELPDGKYEILKPLPFTSPSAAGQFITGRSCNGWDEFIGLDALRQVTKE